MNVTSGVNAQTPLLPPSERGNDEKPVAEIVEFNAYGNKPRCLMCLGTSALFTGVLSGVCSAAVASVSSGATYTTAMTVLGASFGIGGIGMMGICAGLYLSTNSVRTRPA
ncbi:type III secretion system effector SteD [Salmonella enterica]